MSQLNKSAVIRMRKGRLLEDTISKSTTVKEKQPRKLDGDDDGLHLDNLPPRYTFAEFVDEMITEVYNLVKVFLPGCQITPHEKTYTIILNGAVLFTYEYLEENEEDSPIQQILFKFENKAIGSEFSLQKVKLNESVRDYVRYYVGGYLLLVGQTITSLNQVYSDIVKTLYLATGGYDGDVILGQAQYQDERIPRMGGGAGGEEERRLKQEYTEDPDFLKPKLRGVIINRYLDLKNKKFVSQKESVLKGLEELQKKNDIYVPSQIKNRILEGGAADEATGIPDDVKYLSSSSRDFIRPKNFYLHDSLIHFPFYSFITYIPKSASPSHIHFLMVVSDQDIDDIDCNIFFSENNGFTQALFDNSSFNVKITITVPTKRFLFKHIRLEVENIQKLLVIIQNINKLQIHTIEGLSEQTTFEEFVQPNYLFMFLRAEMDNISDGQTAYPDIGVPGKYIGAYHHVDDAGIWRLSIGFKEEESMHLLGELSIEFGTLGESFPFFKLNTEFLFGHEYIFLGERRFPDTSMYNQHFLAKRYLDMFASIVVNSHPILESYKQLITPFATDAFPYGDVSDIPSVADVNFNAIKGLAFQSKIVDANVLTIKEFGTSVAIKSCPVISDEYVDLITLRNNEYTFVGPRRYARLDLDLCYAVVRKPAKKKDDEEGGDERKLVIDNKNVKKSNNFDPKTKYGITENKSDNVIKTMI